MMAPTFCYEANFPRTPKIRKSFVLRRLVELAFLVTLQFILIQQWIIPILQNSQIPFRESNLLKIIERLLKLAVPNHVCWLIGFYCFFHSYLNVLAELLRFGDREFYRDWWNAESVSTFWKTWNIPVHNFCLRHIFKPLVNMGVSRLQASIFVFFISAFFHEYLVSIPLRMFRLWSFLGMIIQVKSNFLILKYFNFCI
jgi:diacylglycerol O-acyltransferase 1